MPVRLCLLAAFTLLSSEAVAQTFKSGVDLIRFDVRIVDQNGRPITDLRQEEVVIEEHGRALPVMLFQRVTEPAESYVDAALRAVTAQVSSNDGFPRGHQYILIFDQQHITPGNEQRARMAAADFIRRHVRPSDRVALFGVPGPGPQIGLTADKTRATKELASIRGSYERRVSTAFGTLSIYEAHRLVQGDERLAVLLLERMASEAGTDVAGGGDAGALPRRAGGGEDPKVTRRVLLENARTVVNQSDAASRQFLQRLADVIAQFRDIEGRKTVVLFSEGFFQDNLSSELEAVAAAAAQSYCVFYSFDLNQRSNAVVSEAYASDLALAPEIHARIAPLSTLAVETDGMMIVDAAARSAQALDRIAEQAQDYYLVGFAPSTEAKAQRGKYQRVTVKVTRPGARVSARTGYAAAPERVVADKKRAIDRVLGAPYVQQGLKLDYTTYVMKASEAGSQRVVLSLTAQLPERSNPTDVADVVFVARDVRDGRVVASGADTIALPAAAAAGTPLQPGTWRVHFNVPAGSYMMRTVVREPGGLVGSADRRIDVRSLDGPDVSASDLVLGSALGGLAVRARAYAADGLTGALETYGRTQAQLASLDVRLELRRVDDNSAVTSIRGEMKETEQDGAGFNRRISFALPLTAVAPGEYLAHATVTAAGEKVAERTRHVEVLAGRAAAGPAPGEPAPSPVDVARGDVARRYLAAIQSRTQGTPAAEAARRAIEGRWEEVELSLRRVTAETADTHALRGFALFAREDYAGAAAALQRSMGLEENALTAFFLGWAQDGAGDSRAALSAWRTAAHLNPSLVSAHLALADGYLKVSQPALAVQALRAGLSALPSSVELQVRLQHLERIKQ